LRVASQVREKEEEGGGGGAKSEFNICHLGAKRYCEAREREREREG